MEGSVTILLLQDEKWVKNDEFILGKITSALFNVRFMQSCCIYHTFYGCVTMSNGEKCKSRIMLPFPQFYFVCFNFYANGRWTKSIKLLSDTVLTYRRRWNTKRCYIFTAAFHPFTCHEGAVNEEQTNAWTKRNMPLENIRITSFFFYLWQCCSYIHLLLRVTRGRGGENAVLRWNIDDPKPSIREI